MTAPVQVRSARPKSVNPADFAAVSADQIDWKLTPVKKLTELTEGTLDGSRYEFERETAGDVEIHWVPTSDSRVGTAGLPEDRAAANAWSAASETLLIELGAHDVSHVTITRDALGKTARAAHLVISAAPFSKATVVLQNTGDALLSENVEIVLGDEAELTVISLQEWNTDAKHLAAHYSRVGRNARLKHIVVSLGGEVIRVNPQTHLASDGSSVEMYGLYFSTSGQHIEQQVYVNHDAPHSKSRVNYKGALQGVGARSVWIGDVLIGAKATGTDSYEQNRNLVLTDGTRADSIPNLEIETGDIEGAGHASATGRFDDEQLFYLQARGISELEARRLVVRGFLNEIVQEFGVTELADRIEAKLASQLELGAN